jgi:protoheme IX farnesyltransferase
MKIPGNGKVIKHVGELMKWKLSAAVTFSSVTGYFLCHGSSPGELSAVVAGVFLLASGAAAMNQYTEIKSDALMERTMGRPLPSGKMEPRKGLMIASILMLTGSIVLSLNGVLPLLLGLLNVVLYNVIYTGLKKKTTLAIIPGALVGAIPPLIGYASAGGIITDPGILLFALFMFLWQLPHFWLLLIRYGKEYEKAGIKTIYNSLNEKKIRRLVFFWIAGSSLLLWILNGILLPFKLPATLTMMGLNIAFIVLFFRVIYSPVKEKWSNNPFILINTFSLLIMIILIFAS